jgi:hypothetical protein
MGFKLIFRTVLFLAILFVMLYVGMTNTANIPFRCDLISPKPIVQPAAIIYFVIFAIGVVAGTLFNVGGGGKSSKGSSSKGGKDK